MLKKEVINEDIGLRGNGINKVAMIPAELSERHIGISRDMWMRQGTIKSEIVSDRDSIIRIIFIDFSCRFSEPIDFVWRESEYTNREFREGRGRSDGIGDMPVIEGCRFDTDKNLGGIEGRVKRENSIFDFISTGGGVREVFWFKDNFTFRVNDSESERFGRWIDSCVKIHNTPPEKMFSNNPCREKIRGSGCLHPEQPRVMSRHPKKGAAKWGKQFGWRPELLTFLSGQSRKEEKHNICQLLLSNLTRTPVFFNYFLSFSLCEITNIIYEEESP